MSDFKGSHYERDIILWEGRSSEKQHREGIHKNKDFGGMVEVTQLLIVQSISNVPSSPSRWF
jgi:hypothetical protein